VKLVCCLRSRLAGVLRGGVESPGAHRSLWSRLAGRRIVWIADYEPRPEGAVSADVSRGLVGKPDSNVKPRVSRTDLQIVARAEQILGSPAVWNRNDNRECPKGAKAVSLYCELEQATMEVTGSFEHRGAVMQEARFAVDEIDGNRNYDHRLMGYNNDRTTTFEDLKHVFRRTRERIEERLSKEK
jgi:hypothetical protein